MTIKLNIVGSDAGKMSSVSAVADYLDADKHLNLGKTTTAGKKVEAAAERFRKAHAKGDAVAARVLGKMEGVKTPKQIEKAMQPIGYYVVRKSAKTENYSAAKTKAGDATYMRKRAFRVSQRKTLSDLYTVLFPVYNAQILDKDAKALQRDLIAAVATHVKGMEGTKAKATKITADNNAAEVADYNGSMKVLKSVLTGADKLKETALFEFTPERGKPALFLNVPGAGFLVVRHCTRAAFLKAKKAGMGPKKSESASDDPAKARYYDDVGAGDIEVWNNCVKALGLPKFKVKTPKFNAHGKAITPVVTGVLPEKDSPRYDQLILRKNGGHFQLVGRCREKERKGALIIFHNSCISTVTGVAHGLRGVGKFFSNAEIAAAKAKSESSDLKLTLFDRFVTPEALPSPAEFSTLQEANEFRKRCKQAAAKAASQHIGYTPVGKQMAITRLGSPILRISMKEAAMLEKVANNIKANLDYLKAAPVDDKDLTMLIVMKVIELTGIGR